ncbi:hypothetical protein [Brevundimonas lenta]|uniref:Uncharacterized protein n=1 Tax=Brevundimonas lenta TaxID=424796 RepID=A0A7W6NQB9_9CAUL|nr:hypothetical protein [Brevundimonas lenta]MBB4083030.1 hypothetical protein [Brevundimonas lenta]
MTPGTWTDPRLGLTGNAVSWVDQDDEGGIGLGFGDDWVLRVWNANSIAGCRLDDLVGQPLVSFIDHGDFERLEFGNGAVVTVDMRAEAFTGPEAMFLSGPDALMIVWP